MLQGPVKLLKKEQFVLLYYRLLPAEGATIYSYTGNVSFERSPYLNIVHQIWSILFFSRFILWSLTRYLKISSVLKN